MLALLAASILQSNPPLVGGLDHLIIAVRDLQKAGRAFERLGFALKPGRPHGNSIRNLHAKFPDGTEIEFITATEPRDDLSRRYVEFLKREEGPIFFALYSTRQDDLLVRLKSLGIRAAKAPYSLHVEKGQGLDPVFFGGRNFSPTDRPEHFRHANGANALRAIWQEKSGSERMRRAMAGLGAKTGRRFTGAPFVGSSEALAFFEGELRFGSIGGRRDLGPIGASVQTSSLDRAMHVLRKNKVPFRAERGRILVVPRYANGAWIEFREGSPSPPPATGPIEQTAAPDGYELPENR